MDKENDIVLVHHEEKPLFFARIEEILPDHKPDWYHIRLLILQLPLQEVTWILRDAYINGDTFTMGGKSMRLELVKAPDPVLTLNESGQASGKSDAEEKETHIQKDAKVICLADLKKKP